MKRDSGQKAMIHPLALCETSNIGPGTRVWPFAHVMEGATIGKECNICSQVFVETGARIGDRVTIKNGVLIWEKVTIESDVFLGPGAVFTNDPTPRSAFKKDPREFVATTVRRGATVGAGAVVLCGIEIGSNAFIAAGAVVVRDVPSHGLVMGNPGRWTAWVCTCGVKLDQELACECGRSYQEAPTGLKELDGPGDAQF